MKSEQLYQALKELAEKLGISVSERSFRNEGMNVGSGLCRIKGKSVFIMDKHISLHKKIRELADCLRQMPLEDVYLVPAVREFLNI